MKLTALSASTMLALPLLALGTMAPRAAQAQPVTGPYVTGSAGYNIPFARNFTESLGGISESIRTSFSGGLAASVGGGYGFGNGLRIELDAGYMHANSGNLSASGMTEKFPGTQNKYDLLANADYDFTLGLPIYPYLGGGFGVQFTTYRSKLFTSFGTNASYDVATNAALDLNAGIAYPIPTVRGLSLTAQYTFLAVLGTENVGRVTSGPDNLRYGFDNDLTNIVSVGLRYQLFNPAPAMAAPVEAAYAPAAAPAPAPARTYLVFFDWDAASLTGRADSIIAEAASASKSGVTTLDVSGYTDTSGTADYNQGLSERRAKTVAAQLVADGVPAAEISIQAFGETHLLVPTGPGVREPQNRRVEIVLN